MSEVGAAGANVTAKHVRPVAFIMDTNRKWNIFIRDLVRITPNIDGRSTNRWQEHLEVAARDQLGVHHVGLAEEGVAQLHLRAPKAPGHLRQVPHRLHRSLGNHCLAVCLQDFIIRLQASRANGLFNLWHINVCLGDSYGGTDVIPLVQERLEHFGNHVTPRIHGCYLFGFPPGRKGSNIMYWCSHIQIRLVLRIKLLSSYSQSLIDAVRAAMSTNSITQIWVGSCSQNWPTL
mmetsp:Transcript_11646/g.17220  ORF Transcript_11646/g.17220 Transcript_11646/m.17220 type:complete len:233 (+) Transcript_11646:765-1463(+)